nr:MAG TPA: hypothetical protein [Caudoviricetes sp.]
MFGNSSWFIPPIASSVPHRQKTKDNEGTTKDKYKLIQLLQNEQKNKAKSGDYACITCSSFVV